MDTREELVMVWGSDPAVRHYISKLIALNTTGEMKENLQSTAASGYFDSVNYTARIYKKQGLL